MLLVRMAFSAIHPTTCLHAINEILAFDRIEDLPLSSLMSAVADVR